MRYLQLPSAYCLLGTKPAILLAAKRCRMTPGNFSSIGVAAHCGLPVRLPIDKGGLTSFSPDGTKIAYSRIFRNFRTWKRYEGGMAQDIAIYDFKNNSYERLTDYPGTDTYPMWHGDTSVIISLKPQ